MRDVIFSVVSIYGYESLNEPKPGKVGSGFVFHHPGIIITANSVTQGCDEIFVQFESGESFRAEKLFSDQYISVLQIDSDSVNPLYYLPFSNELSSGFLTVIGNALGVFPSVTLGKINQINHDGFILFDSHIPPGSSGSPVFNSDCRLVGLLLGRKTAVKPFTENRFELGLILPIDSVYAALTQYFSTAASKVWVGIEVSDMETQGMALVTDVYPGSPAEQAGFMQGDTVLYYQNMPFLNVADLRLKVKNHNPNDRVVFTLTNNGEKRVVSVMLQAK